jgi:DNA repair protein RadC
MKEENLHRGHRERMRAEYLKFGLPLEEYKHLEMLLYYAHPRIDTNTIAHRLINRFGSLQGVFDAGIREFMEVEGVGKSIAVFLKLIGDTTRKIKKPPPAKPGTLLDTPERAEAFVRKCLAEQKSECVLVAYLDAKQRLIHERLAADSAESSARVENSIRVTVSLALKYNAACVLIGHNHPCGNPMPSGNDVTEARRLKDALRSVGIKLNDFIIIGEDGEAYSLVRGGLLY